MLLPEWWQQHFTSVPTKNDVSDCQKYMHIHTNADWNLYTVFLSMSMGTGAFLLWKARINHSHLLQSIPVHFQHFEMDICCWVDQWSYEFWNNTYLTKTKRCLIIWLTKNISILSIHHRFQERQAHMPWLAWFYSCIFHFSFFKYWYNYSYISSSSLFLSPLIRWYLIIAKK